MTRGGMTFKMKSEPFASTVRLNRRARVRGRYPRRQLPGPVRGRGTGGGRGRGRAVLQG